MIRPMIAVPDRDDEAVEQPQRQVGVRQHLLEGLERRALGDQREGRVQQLVAGPERDAEHAQDREEGDERGQGQDEVDQEALERAVLACCSTPLDFGRGPALGDGMDGTTATAHS